MAIQFIGASSAEATTITIPVGHQAGNVMIIFAFRDGSVTNPTIPAGWTTITNTTDGTLCSVSMGYKIATSSSETSGTWTNTSGLVCMVYSGQLQASSASPFGTIAANASASNQPVYPSRTLAASNVTGGSWFLAFCGHTSIDTNCESSPGETSAPSLGVLKKRTNTVGAVAEYVGFDSNGAAVRDWGLNSALGASGGTSGNYQTVVLELKSDSQKMNNYQSFSSTNNYTGKNEGVLSFSR